MQHNMKMMKAEIIHVYQQVDLLADCIVNKAFIILEKLKYHGFAQLPSTNVYF